MEKTLTFDQLPQAVAMLTKEVSELKQLLLQQNDQQTTTLMVLAFSTEYSPCHLYK
jgi:hypothetical protein